MTIWADPDHEKGGVQISPKYTRWQDIRKIRTHARTLHGKVAASGDGVASCKRPLIVQTTVDCACEV